MQCKSKSASSHSQADRGSQQCSASGPLPSPLAPPHQAQLCSNIVQRHPPAHRELGHACGGSAAGGHGGCGPYRRSLLASMAGNSSQAPATTAEATCRCCKFCPFVSLTRGDLADVSDGLLLLALYCHIRVVVVPAHMGRWSNRGLKRLDNKQRCSRCTCTTEEVEQQQCRNC